MKNIGNRLAEGYELRQEGEGAYVGRLEMQNNTHVVILDKSDPRFGRIIKIARRHLNGAPLGMKVVVELTAVTGQDNAHGKIVEVLGNPDSPDVAITGIIRSYNLREKFPETVLEEVEGLPNDPTEEIITDELAKGRLDLRTQPCFTIDGLDARDLDDAISIERLAEGYRLWVHIADVTHYVIPHTELDKEAFRRGNSVYLVDRVLPMLPPKLSNGLCSLNPDKERLCLSCRIDYDGEANVVDGELCETVIQSKLRSSYEEVREYIAKGSFEDETLPDWFSESIDIARELSSKLSKKRQDRGALVFDFPETKIILDADGKVLDIYGEKQDEANQLIESFMIAANEYVAEYCDARRLPAIYRVHEDPNEEKIEAVFQFARELGLSYRMSHDFSPGSVQELLEKFKKEAYGTTLSEMLLRSLAKARYDAQDLGHFGLASTQYCHFTAPIRRYSDIVVHRAIKNNLQGQHEKKKRQGLKIVANHISLMERLAIDAERDTTEQKIVEYYADKLGEIYEGVISGFSQSSLYVRLPNTVEGSVFYADMETGYVQYVEERLMAKNTHNGENFHIGDPVKVQVAKVDMERRFLDFKLLEHTDLYGGTDVHRKNSEEKKQSKFRRKDKGQGVGRSNAKKNLKGKLNRKPKKEKKSKGKKDRSKGLR